MNGCYYNKKSADEIWTELNYIKSYDDGYKATHYKHRYFEDEFVFYEDTKNIVLNSESMSMQELQAIIKKCEELRLERINIMEDEIKVGEWIRTKTGYIGQLNKISTYKINNKDKTMYLCRFSKSSWVISLNDIAKHSRNIIDLIEAKDMVNNKMVKKVFIDPFTKKKRLELEGTEINWQGDMSSIYCEANEINTIITKEQMASIEYKVIPEEN